MGINKYLSLGLIFVIGCTTALTDNVDSVFDHYERIVFDDGISLEEAKVIAQKQLIKKNVVGLYDLSNPLIARDVAELPDYQDYWFVFFEEKKLGSIPFIFMVLVNKETGKIKFADDYNEGNQWILEAALLR